MVLTNEDKERYWKNNERISVIPNPVRFFPNTIASLNSKRIIAAGRLTYQKNYSSLIHAYSLIANRYPGWRLDIFGEGPDKKALQEEINSLGRPVTFLGDGTPVFAEMISFIIKVPYRFAPAHVNRQHASSVAALGAVYYANGECQPAADHRPEYLRLSQAERERLEKKGSLQ